MSFKAQAWKFTRSKILLVKYKRKKNTKNIQVKIIQIFLVKQQVIKPYRTLNLNKVLFKVKIFTSEADHKVDQICFNNENFKR